MAYSWVVLFHNAQSNDARFMHKLCLSLHAMNRVMGVEVEWLLSTNAHPVSNSYLVCFEN